MFVEMLKEHLGHQPGKQLKVDEATAKSLISQGLAKEIPDPTNGIVDNAIAQASQRLAQSMDAVINSALKQFADAQSKSRKNAVPAIFGEGNQGDPKKTFGDWCLAVARGDRDYLEKHYGSHFVQYTAKAAMSELGGLSGGYIVPPEMYAGLVAVMEEETFFRKHAFVQPMGTATLMVPYLDVTTVQPAGTSPFFGGVVMNWTEEAQNRIETEPQFKQLELKAHELSGYAVSSNVLLQDAVFGLEKYLFQLFGRAIGWFEEYAFLQGNGVGKPLGVLNSPALISSARNTAGHVKYADVATMISKLLPLSLKRAIWVCHPYVLSDLVQLSDAAGRVVWIANQGAQGGAQLSVPGFLFGQPVYVTEKLPALGTKGDIMLIDPQLYVIGDRMQVEVAASQHVNFLKNQMTWRIVERVDGQPWVEKAITLQDAASTVSPFIAINT